MSLNADGNTAVTACLWEQLADCSMCVMLLRETNSLPELTDGLTALTAWVTRQTESDSEIRAAWFASIFTAILCSFLHRPKKIVTWYGPVSQVTIALLPPLDTPSNNSWQWADYRKFVWYEESFETLTTPQYQRPMSPVDISHEYLREHVRTERHSVAGTPDDNISTNTFLLPTRFSHSVITA